MSLSDAAIHQAKPGAKPFKLSDSDGMFLLVNPNGAKYWRLKFRFAGKEKLLALGVSPAWGQPGATICCPSDWKTPHERQRLFSSWRESFRQGKTVPMSPQGSRACPRGRYGKSVGTGNSRIEGGIGNRKGRYGKIHQYARQSDTGRY